MNISKKNIFFMCFVLILTFLDQFSKEFFIVYLKTQPDYNIEVTPFLDIVHAWNYGISFGLFQQYYQYSNIVFMVLNSLIILYLCYLHNGSTSKVFSVGIDLIIGGAIGNLFDRIYRGAVFDFIYFNYGDYSFPAFNLADSFITIGACIVFYEYIFLTPGDQKNLDTNNN